MAPAAVVYAIQRESLGRYIRERKLLLAARDLRESDARVYDICLRYGFDSQQTFTRIFTRTFNQPPGRIVKRTTAGHTELFYPVAVSLTGPASRLRRQRKPAAPDETQHEEFDGAEQ